MKRISLKYKEEPKKSGWFYLLFWKDNISYFLNTLKNRILINYLHKCPNCYSTNMDYVEGGTRFSKIFCSDCMAMHYRINCPSCNKKIWFVTKYKKHIMKEYRLGKFKGDLFYKKTKEDYFISNIDFHKEALKEWKKRYKIYKDKKIKIKYGY